MARAKKFPFGQQPPETPVTAPRTAAPCALMSAAGQTAAALPKDAEAAIDIAALALARLLGRQVAGMSMTVPIHAGDARHDG